MFGTRNLWVVILALGGVLTASQVAEARSFRLAQVPNGTTLSCDTCHIFPGGPRNDFGLQVEDSLTEPKSSANVDWQLLFGLDADGDGFTNGQELGDPDGDWEIGNPNPTLESDPNNEFDVPAGGDPRCTPGAETVCDGQDNNCDGTVDEGLVCDDPLLSNFTMDATTIVADGVEVQTFRLTLAHAGSVDDIRLLVNHPWHAENGRTYDGYFKTGPGLCEEVGAGLGNDTVALDTGACTVTDNPDGTKTFAVSFTAEGAFGAASNNQVSAIWFEGGVAARTWQALTASGQGFDVTADPNFTPPASLSSFTFDKASVSADGTDVQTLRLTLDNATDIDDVRIVVNHPWHVENGREISGYFQITPQTCTEVGGGLGNDKVTLDTGTCERNTDQNGTTEYVLRYTIDGSYGAATNTQVSAIWFDGGVPISGTWLRVSSPGAGFDILEDPNFVPPASFSSFTFDEASFAADGFEVQTLRLTLDNATNVDDIRLIINHPWHAENGRSYDGYLQITPETCTEVGAGLGNDNIVLLDNCERNTDVNGTTEYVLNFVAAAGFGVSTNHQVSAIWYEGEVAVSGTWQQVTASGQGFDVTEGTSSVRSFSFDQASVVADGVEVQTFRLVLNNAAAVTDLRFLVNHNFHAENGRTYDGYFQATPEGCAEFTGSFGNDTVELLTELCEQNVAEDGSIEYVLNFTVDASHGAASNNQVSIFWMEGETLISSWTRVTTSGQGYDVTLP